MKAFWVAMVAAGMLSLGGYAFGEEAAVASTQSATAQDESVAKKTNNTNGVAAPKECKGGDCAKKAAAPKECKGGDCAKKAAAKQSKSANQN